MCCMVLDGFLDMSYFCQCLGEDIREEGLKYIGYGQSDENSVVVDSVVEDDDTSSQEDERTFYSF